jgi:hypothetical protein
LDVASDVELDSNDLDLGSNDLDLDGLVLGDDPGLDLDDVERKLQLLRK